jgi:hypothetical protein
MRHGITHGGRLVVCAPATLENVSSSSVFLLEFQRQAIIDHNRREESSHSSTQVWAL